MLRFDVIHKTSNAIAGRLGVVFFAAVTASAFTASAENWPQFRGPRGDGTSLEDLTRGFFARRKLIGGNLYAAMSEVVAHIELLEDIGDIRLADDRGIHSTGSENYKQLIHELTS